MYNQCTDKDIDNLSDINQLQLMMILGRPQGWCRPRPRPLGALVPAHAQLQEETAGGGASAQEEEEEEKETGRGKTAELEEEAAGSERSALLEEVEAAGGGTEEDAAPCWRRSSKFSQSNCTTNAEEKRKLPRTVKRKHKVLH